MALQQPAARPAPIPGISRAVMFLAVALPAIVHAQTTTVLPGQSVTLPPFNYDQCEAQSQEYKYTIDGVLESPELPFVNCDVSQSVMGKLKVRAGTGAFVAGGGLNQTIEPLSDPLRYGFAVGRIGNTIQIPVLESGQVGSEVLAAQISTEVEWNGLLWNRRISIPSWAQIVATLQLRDLTTGSVVASNTFLNERADLDSTLPANFGDFSAFAYGWTSVQNASGVDLTAQLVRGRTYRIEIEAKCEDLSVVFPVAINPFELDPANVGAALWSGGGCFFTDADTPSSAPDGDALSVTLPVAFPFFNFNLRYNVINGGFFARPLTVTVQDDTKARLAEVLNRDDDGDGISNSVDACPDSDLSLTVVIDGCDSGAANTQFPSGCSLSDEIAKCALASGNHGQFLSCVAHLTKDVSILDEQGPSVWAAKGALQSCAAQANIP
jgi:hypothetical protein